MVRTASLTTGQYVEGEEEEEEEMLTLTSLTLAHTATGPDHLALVDLVRSSRLAAPAAASGPLVGPLSESPTC